VSSIVASRFAGDPAMMALLESMRQREAPAPRGRRADEREADDDDDDLRRAKRMIRRLQRDLEAADEVLFFLAELLGACPSCFGASQRCMRCAGRGRPGAVKPRREELLAWIEPALARLGLRVQPIEQRTTDRTNEEMR
jgi:hypothetical protein